MLALVGADVAITVIGVLVGFGPALAAPTVVVALLAFLADRGIRWARFLLVVMAGLGLSSVIMWFIDTVRAELVRGVLVTVGFAAAYIFAIYVLAISDGARAFFEERRAERVNQKRIASV